MLVLHLWYCFGGELGKNIEILYIENYEIEID